MIDYFNQARLVGQGGGSTGQLPIGVLNGVSYYSADAYQRAVAAQRAKEAAARQTNMANVPANTYSTSYGAQTVQSATNAAGANAPARDPIFSGAAGAAVPSGAYSTSYGGGNFTTDTNAAGANATRNQQIFSQNTGANVPAGAYQTSYGGGNFINDTNAAGANAPARDPFFNTTRNPAVPAGAYQTSYGGGNFIDDTNAAGANAPARDPFFNTTRNPAVPAGAYQTSYGGGNFIDDTNAAGANAPARDPIFSGAAGAAVPEGVYNTSYGAQNRGDADIAVSNVLRNAPESSTLGGLGDQTNWQEIAYQQSLNTGNTLQAVDDAPGSSMSDGLRPASSFDDMYDDEARMAYEAGLVNADGTPTGGTTPPPTETEGGEGEGETDDAYKAAYERNLANLLEMIDNQKLNTGQSYSDMYRQIQDQLARQASLTNPEQMTGGMAQQEGSRRSAAEIAAFGQIGTERERAVRDIESQKFGAELTAKEMAAQEQQLDQAMDPRYQQIDAINTMLQNAIEVGDAEAIEKLYPQLQSVLGSIAGLDSGDFNFSVDSAAEGASQARAITNRRVQDLMKEGGLPQAVTDALAAAGLGLGGVAAGSLAVAAGSKVASWIAGIPLIGALTATPGTAIAADGIGKFGLWAAKGGKLAMVAKGATGLAAITPVGWAVLGLAVVGSLAWYGYRQYVANLPADQKDSAIREIAEKEARVVKGEGASQEIIDAWIEDYMGSLK